jgi:hypothetical protein
MGLLLNIGIARSILERQVVLRDNAINPIANPETLTGARKDLHAGRNYEMFYSCASGIPSDASPQLLPDSVNFERILLYGPRAFVLFCNRPKLWAASSVIPLDEQWPGTRQWIQRYDRKFWK